MWAGRGKERGRHLQWVWLWLYMKDKRHRYNHHDMKENKAFRLPNRNVTDPVANQECNQCHLCAMHRLSLRDKDEQGLPSLVQERVAGIHVGKSMTFISSRVFHKHLYILGPTLDTIATTAQRQASFSLPLRKWVHGNFNPCLGRLVWSNNIWATFAQIWEKSLSKYTANAKAGRLLVGFEAQMLGNELLPSFAGHGETTGFHDSCNGMTSNGWHLKAHSDCLGHSDTKDAKVFPCTG